MYLFRKYKCGVYKKGILKPMSEKIQWVLPSVFSMGQYQNILKYQIYQFTHSYIDNLCLGYYQAFLCKYKNPILEPKSRAPNSGKS